MKKQKLKRRLKEAEKALEDFRRPKTYGYTPATPAHQDTMIGRSPVITPTKEGIS